MDKTNGRLKSFQTALVFSFGWQDMRLFAFKGVEKIWPAGKGVGDLRKCKLLHQQKLSPRREQSYLF